MIYYIKRVTLSHHFNDFGLHTDNVACGKKKCNRCVLEKNARGCGVCKCAAANTAQKCGQRPVNCKTECLTMVEGCLKCICLNVTPGPLLPIGNISLQIYGDSIAQNTTKLMCRSATKCTANCSFIKTENDCYRCDCGIVSTPSPTTQASIYTTVACEKIVDCKGNCTFVQYDWSENGCSMCHCT